MFTENQVIEAVVKHLKANDYEIVSQCNTGQRGVDIVAKIPGISNQLLVEAKGGTSSKLSTARFGKPFSANQAKTHVSVAFFYAAKLQNQYSTTGCKVALAFPNDCIHRSLTDGIRRALETLELTVFLIDKDLNVETYIGQLAPKARLALT